MSLLQKYSLVENFILTEEQKIFYRIYKNEQLPKRRLLMLHGAGVNGYLTWATMINYLSHWSEILVPDLRGTGKTNSPDSKEREFTCTDVLNDLKYLLHYLDWGDIDIAGYSFGGLIAMLLKQQWSGHINNEFLLESALVYGLNKDELLEARQAYKRVLPLLHNSETVEEGISQFVDLVSPKRKRLAKAEALFFKRLIDRPIGFAHAIQCVNSAVLEIDRDELLQVQENVISINGELSHSDIYPINKKLQETRQDWQVHIIPGADHALPFQKPRQIAKLINETSI